MIYQPNFASKYENSVGIGSKVGDLKALGKDLKYDDEDIIIGNDWGLIMVANDDLMSMSDEEMDECIIESMVIKRFM